MGSPSAGWTKVTAAQNQVTCWCWLPLIHHFPLLPDDAGPNHYLSPERQFALIYQSITIKRIDRSGLVAYYSLEDFANQ